MNSDDQEALDKIIKWENDYINNSKNSFIKKGFDKINYSIKPIADPIKDKFRIISDSKISNRIKDAIKVAISGAFNFTHDNIKYTYDKYYILKRLNIKTYNDLFKFNSDHIEKLVNLVANKNKVISALEGFGLGLGGIETTLLEIPIFFSIIARVQQQICSCYGYDAESDFEKSYMLKALSFSDLATVAGKTELLIELNTLKVAIRRHTYKQLNDMGGKYLLPEIAKRFATQQGKSLTKKKMGQAIPIIGGAIGGLFNYGYINNIINVTNKLYKKRFLEDKKIYLDKLNT